jgi:excinuclease ABC subunit C
MGHTCGMFELDAIAEFHRENEAEFLAAIPARHAVFAVEPRAELHRAEPFLLRTADLRDRLTRLLAPAEPESRRLNLREFAGSVRYRIVGSSFEAAWLHWEHARTRWPENYRERLRMRPPAVLKVSLANAYPRCYATRRISASGFYFGPFASRRAADSFASGCLELFKIRRCQIKIRRDPQFAGCMYSEMKMCLAPCFAGCTKTDYDAEVHRVTAFLASRGGSLSTELQQERERASQALEFENAAATHRRMEKAAAALRGLPELARGLKEWNAVILQRSAEKNAVAIFPVRGGRIGPPHQLRFGEMAGASRSVEQVIREWLEPAAEQAPAGPPSDAHAFRELEDHLALLARWYYAKPRVGEIFFREGAAGGSAAPSQDAARARRNLEWPYRKILRACTRLLSPAPAAPPKPQP